MKKLFIPKLEIILGCNDSEGIKNCLFCGRHCKRDKILQALNETFNVLKHNPPDKFTPAMKEAYIEGIETCQREAQQ